MSENWQKKSVWLKQFGVVKFGTMTFGAIGFGANEVWYWIRKLGKVLLIKLERLGAPFMKMGIYKMIVTAGE